MSATPPTEPLRDYFGDPVQGHAWTGRPGAICECGWDDLASSWRLGLHEAFRQHVRQVEAHGEQLGLFG